MVSIPWYYTHSALKKAPIEQVDTSVKRIFQSFINLGIFDTLSTRPNDTAFSVNASTPERKAFTQELVHQSSVLLKNDNQVLPLEKKEGGQHYLVIGNQAMNPVTFGGGSGESHPLDVLPPLHALCDELGIERMSTWSVFNRHCNDKGDCITYIDIPSNAGGPHYSILFLGER